MILYDREDFYKLADVGAYNQWHYDIFYWV